MKQVTIKLLKSNCKTNKLLLDFIKPTVRDVITSGYTYNFVWAKSDGKTEYPRMLVSDQQQYVGLSRVRNGINTIINMGKQRNRKISGDDDYLHNHQINSLYSDDDDDDDDNDDFGMNPLDIQSKMEAYRNRRNRNASNKPNEPSKDDYDSYDEPPHPRKKSKYHDQDRHVEINNEPEIVQPNSRKKKPRKSSRKGNNRSSEGASGSSRVEHIRGGGKKQQVVEQMLDDDIGASFVGMKSGSGGNMSKDDLMMENLFVNMQESPVSL